MTELCIILIRSGSKSIKDKNIKKINSYPLIYYTLKSALKSNIFKKIIISSDSKRYFAIINKFFPNEKKIVFFLRSKKYARDKTSSEDSIFEIFKKKKNLISVFSRCYFIQATSPLLKKEDLIISKKIFIKQKLDSLFSGYKEKIFYWKKNKNSNYSSINYNFKKRPRRQNFDYTFFENGAFYIFNIKLFMKFKNRLFGNIGFFEMPKYRSFEIDEPNDLNFIKKII